MSDADFLADWQEERRAERLAEWKPPIVPARFVAAALADFPGKVGEILTSWAMESKQTKNLLIYGPVGPGKTRAAFAACRERFIRGEGLSFWPVVELLDALRPSGGTATIGELMAVDVLVLDDLATEKATEWTAERLFAIVNRRWMEERPIVATTNLPPKELEAALGERLFSRVVGDGTVVLRMTGADRRRAPRSA